MIRLRIVAVALGLALVAGTAHGAPAQMDPEVEPTTTGPLVNSNETYATAENPRCTKAKTKAEDGMTVGVTELCFSFYRFDPTQETDAARDYGVWWFQATLKPKNGWCAKKLKGDLSMSPNGQYHAFTGKDFETGRSKTVINTLKVDAEGFGSSTATVKKEFVVHPRTTTGGFSKKHNRLNLVWKGATKKTVGLAGGVEGSWESEIGPGAFGAGALPTLTSTC